MSNSLKTQKRSFFSRAVAGLVLVALTAACNSPTSPTPPSRSPTAPSQPTPPSRNWPDLAGTYKMTLSASNRCPSDFPDAMRARTYTATIGQAGGALTVTLSGRGFFPGWADAFPGGISDSDEVVFQLLFWEWLDAPDFELIASGRMTTTISADGLSGFLDGSLEAIVANEDGRGSRLATCTESDHRVVFSR